MHDMILEISKQPKRPRSSPWQRLLYKIVGPSDKMLKERAQERQRIIQEHVRLREKQKRKQQRH